MLAAIILATLLLLVGFYVWIIRTALEVEDDPADHLGGDDPDGRGGVAAGRGFHGEGV